MSRPIHIGDRKKLYAPDESSDGWAISSYDCWIPGIYATEESARLAFEFCDDVLIRLMDAVRPAMITLEQLQSVTDRVCASCQRASSDRKGTAMRIHTVGELIEALRRYPQDAPVLGTWEGTTPPVAVYATPEGVVLLDSDNEDYRDEYESGKRKVDPHVTLRRPS